jgi:hypothetical protein
MISGKIVCTTLNSVLDFLGTNEPNQCSNFRMKLSFIVYLTFVFVFPEKGPGTSTRAREFFPLVTALCSSIGPS